MSKTKFAFWGDLTECQKYNEDRRNLITDNWELGLNEVRKLGRYPVKSDGAMYGWWERVLITMDNNSANKKEYDAMIKLCNEIDPSIIKESWEPETEIVWYKPIKFTYKQINFLVMAVFLILGIVFGVLSYFNFDNPARADFVTVSCEACILMLSCGIFWFVGNKGIWISILSDYEYRTASRDSLDFLIKLAGGISVMEYLILRILVSTTSLFSSKTIITNWMGVSIQFGKGPLATFTLLSPIMLFLITLPFIGLFLLVRKTRFKLGLSDMRWYIALLLLCFNSLIGISMFCVGLIFGRLIWMGYWKKLYGSVPKFKIPLIPVYTFYWFSGMFFSVFLIPIFLH